MGRLIDLGRQKKLVDTDDKISIGGRAHRFWQNKDIKHSNRFEIEKQDRLNAMLSPFEIMKKYKIRGFEFGNWVDNNTRNDNLLACTDSLRDLAKIIGSENLGLDNTLAIAFGARGKSHASAHYEPANEIINLTKMYGMGALAHEYGHALDYFFGGKIDQNKNYVSLVGGNKTARTLSDNTGGELRAVATSIIDSCISVNGELTESYKRLQGYAKSNIYWYRRAEIFARLFEQYVSYKLSTMGIKNTFLAAYKYEHAVYLTKADFARVLPKLNMLMFSFQQFLNNKKTKITPVTLPAVMKVAATKSVRGKMLPVIKKALKTPENEPKKIIKKPAVKKRAARPKEDNFLTVYKAAPKAVQALIDKTQDNSDYRVLEKLKKDLVKYGYFLDYGLDGSVTEFRKLKTKTPVKKVVTPKAKAPAVKKQAPAKTIAPKPKTTKKSTGRADKPKVVNKSVSISLNTAVADVLKLKRYSKLTAMEATILYNKVKSKDWNYTEDGLTGAMLKSLDKKGFISVRWTNETFNITSEGVALFKAIRGRLETLKGLKYGYNLFN